MSEQLQIALWTGKSQLAPPEYTDLVLCRLYHCTPAELDEQDNERVMIHLALYNAEQKIAEARRKTQTSR